MPGGVRLALGEIMGYHIATVYDNGEDKELRAKLEKAVDQLNKYLLAIGFEQGEFAIETLERDKDGHYLTILRIDD